MSRRRITVVCDRHEPAALIGVLFPPARDPASQEEVEAAVQQWISLFAWTEPELTQGDALAKAQRLARKNERAQTEITYESNRNRRTKAGAFRTTIRDGIYAEIGRDGQRYFVFRCKKCGPRTSKTVRDSRLLEVLGSLAAPGNRLLLSLL